MLRDRSKSSDRICRIFCHETGPLHRGIAGHSGVCFERSTHAIPCPTSKIAGARDAHDVPVTTYLHIVRGTGEPGAGIVPARRGSLVAKKSADGRFPAVAAVSDTAGGCVSARTGIRNGRTISAVHLRIIPAARRNDRAFYCADWREGELTHWIGVPKMECKRAGVAHW